MPHGPKFEGHRRQQRLQQSPGPSPHISHYNRPRGTPRRLEPASTGDIDYRQTVGFSFSFPLDKRATTRGNAATINRKCQQFPTHRRLVHAFRQGQIGGIGYVEIDDTTPALTGNAPPQIHALKRTARGQPTRRAISSGKLAN
jgi:hypothetical protein